MCYDEIKWSATVHNSEYTIETTTKREKNNLFMDRMFASIFFSLSCDVLLQMLRLCSGWISHAPVVYA